MPDFPLPKIAPQCCDADGYVDFGEVCFKDGICHGELRPAGDYFWFSLPPRMGWPTEALVVANFAVVVLSVFLSLLALRAVLRQVTGRTVSHWQTLGLLLLTSGVHAVFIRPTVFNTLSDPPANMFLLSGVWLLLLGWCRQNGGVIRVLQFAAAGLILGLAAWLRAFYLYPVLVFAGVYLLLWLLLARQRKLEELLLLLCLLPIAAQHQIIHRHYGTYTYLQAETTSAWSEVHLNQPFTGFDTIFPRNGYFWQPRGCESRLGILNGLQAGDFRSVACVLSSRLQFYLGTYEPKTYIFTSLTNQLPRQFAENIGDRLSDWFPQSLSFEKDVALSPPGQHTADRLTVLETDASGHGDVVQWVVLRGNAHYTFSVWLWSPLPRTINLAIKKHWDDKPLAISTVTLTPEPVRYAVTGYLDEDALVDVDIGRTPYPQYPISFGTRAGDHFYAWGAQLELGAEATPYNADEKVQEDSIRRWRAGVLVANSVALMLCVASIIRGRAFWLQQRAPLAVLALFATAGAVALAIIPEQRFAIGLMIFIWLLAGSFLLQGKRTT